MSRTSFYGFALMLLSIPSSTAFAHFIWVVSENGVAKIYFGEGPEADQAKFLDGIAATKVFRANGTQLEAIEFSKLTDGDRGWFQIQNDQDASMALTCDYGVFTRGEKSMRLDYAARYQRSDTETLTCTQLRFDLRTAVVGGKLRVIAYFEDRPAEGVEIVVAPANNKTNTATLTTDSQGVVEFDANGSSRWLIRGKRGVAQEGEWHGKKYSDHQYYCTVVFDRVADKTVSPNTSLDQVAQQPSYPELPVAITSFGATRNGDSIFVLGGQMGDAHAYAKSWQNGKLFQLDLNSPKPEWKTISEQGGVQGLALVAHGNRLYRLGGFEARNSEGEENDLHSLDKFNCFDLNSKSWTDLPSLPQPRSSFDACVVDGKIYVIGGWSMRGSESTNWCDTALMFDLSQPDGKWIELPKPPFQRRALCVVANNHRIYAIGGIDESGQTSNVVDVFDVERNQWQECAPLPECGSLNGFGSCAFELNQSVVVSVSDGQFFKYDESEKTWLPLEQQLDPGRFFHRVFPVSISSVIAIGGASMEIGKFKDTGVVDFEPSK